MAASAKAMFPRGLLQPEEGFRFAVDALLLACFPRLRLESRFLDLGTGCGVVGLGMLLRSEGATVTGVGLDVSPVMTGAARENASRLGLQDRFSICEWDVRTIQTCGHVAPEGFDLVVANPPYRQEGCGRVSPGEEKRLARFEIAADMDTFLAAGAFALKNRGRLAVIHLAERLADLFASMRASRLEPKRLRLVAGHAGAAPKLVLVEAVKNGKPGLAAESTLVLHADRQGRAFTPEAVSFCPFLR